MTRPTLDLTVQGGRPREQLTHPTPPNTELRPSKVGVAQGPHRIQPGLRLSDALALSALLAGVITLHISVPGLVPSGGDGGSWLTLAHERLGPGVMAADVTYAPIFPGLLGLLLLVTEPLAALTAAAVLAKASVVTAAYWFLRGAGRPLALAGAVLIGTAGWQLEVYAWGGYPQLLATGFALVASYAAVSFLHAGSRKFLVLVFAGSLAVVATHKLIAGLLPVALGAAIFHTLWLTSPIPEVGARIRGVIAAAAGPTLLYVVQSVVDLARGFHPVLNPLDHGKVLLLEWTVREATVPWAVLVLGAALAALYRSWPDHLVGVVSMGIGWVAAGFGFFLISGEQRALALTQLGVVLLVVPLFTRWSGPGLQLGRPGWPGRPSLFVVGVFLLGSVSAAGVDYYVTATEWYRVVDRPELEVLDRLRMESNPGDVVVASRGRNGNPIGWWVEGYALRPTYSGIDVSFEAFPLKRHQAEIANSIFSGHLTQEETFRLLKEIGARYLLVDLRGPDAEWMSAGVTTHMKVLFRSPSLAVLGFQPEP